MCSELLSIFQIYYCQSAELTLGTPRISRISETTVSSSKDREASILVSLSCSMSGSVTLRYGKQIQLILDATATYSVRYFDRNNVHVKSERQHPQVSFASTPTFFSDWVWRSSVSLKAAFSA